MDGCYNLICLLGILLDYFSGAMSQCGGSTLNVLVPDYGISVLAYPGGSSPNYGQLLECKWLFRSADTTLKLLFRVDDMLVGCGDILQPFDGPTDRSPEIGSSLCTSQNTPTSSSLFTTSSNQMFLTFDTDSSTPEGSDKGFKVEILSAKPMAYEAEACNSNMKTLRATTDEEVLTSPRFPDSYQSDRNCFWNITSPAKPGTIRINVLFLDTDVYSGKCYDYITTNDGKESRKLCDLKRFKQITLLSYSSYVEIRFYSDDGVEGVGFLLLYSFLAESTTIESTTLTTKTTTEISTAEATTTTTSVAETTTSTAETTMSTAETKTMPTSESTTMQTAESTTISNSETTLISTSEKTTGAINTETAITETALSKDVSSRSPTSGTLQNQILSLSLEAVILLEVLIIVILCLGITACTVFYFSRNKKRNGSTVSSCSRTLPHWRRHFIEVDYFRNKNVRNNKNET